MSLKKSNIDIIPEKRLGDIAKIRAGFAFRKKVEPVEGGEVYAIQMKNLDKNYTRIAKNPYKVKLDRKIEKHLLKEGEVLFVSKGTNNFAFVFDESNPYKKAVASSTFFVLKTRDDVVPGYLAWYINQQSAQRHFEKTLEGTSQRNITRKSLSDLIIKIPSKEHQEIIAELYKLSRREQDIVLQLKEKRELLLQTTLFNSINF